MILFSTGSFASNDSFTVDSFDDSVFCDYGLSNDIVDVEIISQEVMVDFDRCYRLTTLLTTHHDPMV